MRSICGRLLGPTAIAAFLLVAMPNIAFSQTGTVKIGIIGPMTGPLASMGEQMAHGARAAVQAINSEGGVGGRRVELVQLDDGCVPARAIEAADRAIVMEKIRIAIGHGCAPASIAAVRKYAKAGIVQIEPVSGASAFSQPGLWNAFRLAPRDDRQGEVASMFIASRYQGKRVTIVAEDTPFGATVSSSLLASLQSAGFQSIREHKYARGAIGERAFPDAVRDRPDVIFIAGWRPDILQTLESLGGQTSGPTIVATSTALPVDEALARRVSERAFIVAKPPHAQIAAQGAPLNEVGAYTFAAVQVAGMALQKARGGDGKAVADVLRLPDNTWRTIMGDFTFDSRGDATGPDYRVISFDATGRNQMAALQCPQCAANTCRCNNSCNCSKDCCKKN